jgi:hypothetical protein
MNQTPERQALVANVTDAAALLVKANADLYAFDARPNNNVFATLAEAERRIENDLSNEASEDCEGAGNCGNETYTRHFIVDGIEYVGTLSVEYNRHDKTYYYVDGTSFSYAKFEAETASESSGPASA